MYIASAGMFIPVKGSSNPKFASLYNHTESMSAHLPSFICFCEQDTVVTLEKFMSSFQCFLAHAAQYCRSV